MRLILLILVLVLAGLPAVALGASAPPGATAQCRDGTYSFSQHHSGTCSHHGGVARWLDGASSSSSPPGRTDTAAVLLGPTVILHARTQTAHCRLGPNPDRRCSPGAY